MNSKDKEVLEALVDYSHFSRFIKEVETYARKKAFALDVSEDAVFDAVNKVTDWLMKGVKVDHPASYINAIIHNALVDYGKADKSTDDTSPGDLAMINGGDSGFYGKEDEGGCAGWHVIEIDEKPPKKVKKEGAVKIPKFGESLAGFLSVLELLERYAPNEVRQAYKQLTQQFNGIPSSGQKRIMEYYLLGYRQIDIVDELDKSTAYVSRIVNKWLRIWGWSKKDVERGKVIILTHHIDELYRGLQHERNLPQRLYDEVTSNLETKAYFHALAESESENLVELCKRLEKYYAPKVMPDWHERVRWEVFENQEWENTKKERVKFLRQLPKEKRLGYLNAWIEEAKYFNNDRFVNFIDELEGKLTF